MAYDFFRTTDDLSIRYGEWLCRAETGRGSIVLLNGRTEFMEKYAETIEALRQRGFDVFSLDWRGQGLSDRMLPNRQKGFVADFKDYVADLKRFMGHIVKPRAPRPIIMLAHSMGAHIGIRYLHDDPDLFSKAVFSSPLIDLPSPWFLRQLLKVVSIGAVKAGKGGTYAIGSKDYRPDGEWFENNPYTSDKKRFDETRGKVLKNTKLASGGVTFRWISAMFDSIKTIHASGYAEVIKTPVLFIAAGDDKVVSIRAQEIFSRRLSHGAYVEIDHSRHEILMESDGYRSIFWDHFDHFVDREKSRTAG